MVVSYREFIHPEDKAAQDQLTSIPIFLSCVKMFMKMGLEQMMHGSNLAEKILLGPNQLPTIYNHVPPVCERLGIDIPEVYLEMTPFPNAYTYGDTRPFLVVTSGLIEWMEEEELHAVVAHECGHIVCRHTLYHTMASVLTKIGPKIFGPLAAVSLPVQLALLRWVRRSELSADRAAAAVLGNPKPVVETMIRLAGGPKAITKDVNIDLYLKQADAYDRLQESSWDRLLQTWAVLTKDHPFASVRAREIMRWSETDHFQRLAQTLREETEAGVHCPKCGAHVKANWKFCSACGTPNPQLSAESKPQTVQSS